VNKSSSSPFSTKNTTSGRMLGCYIVYSESLVEVDRVGVKDEGQSDRTRKFEVKVIENSNRLANKRSKGGHVVTN
jgi:hypothetical protein